jgi:hypothetical protein
MYQWEEVKQAVEREEDARLARSLSDADVREGRVKRRFYLVQRTRPILEGLGGLVLGVHASLLALAFNYLLFVWILHVNFDG